MRSILATSVRAVVASAFVLAWLAIAVDADAIEGDQATTCASYGLEEGSTDECFGGPAPPARVSRAGVVRFHLYCMESPGDRCSGRFEIPWIRRTNGHFYDVNASAGFAVDAGRAGGVVKFKLSSNAKVARRRAKDVRRHGGALRIWVFTRQASGEVERTSIEEIDIRHHR